ncbi:MAG: type I-U CRISPR-associated helicase/endonuclease Cas3 [Longimicrobiales bacterium]
MSTPFEAWFAAVWGHAPHPWQRRLAAHVVEDGWPRVLDLPTGTGKTAVLDIALFHLLSDPEHAPRRIVLVVDRRVIVDQVGARARHLLSAIESADQPAAAWARSRLREVVGPDTPLLEASVLRGGVMRSDSWAHYPHVPVLAASTVDQVGSRLLFRGYGLSPWSQPIHAGLLGCDALYLLDEVHLSRVFAHTLEQLIGLGGGDSSIPRRITAVQLSATPGSAGATKRVFRLGDEDRESAFLRPILQATKPARLVEVDVKANAEEPTKRGLLASAAASEARHMVAEGTRVVGVVVNRVDTARRTWKELRKASQSEYDLALVTGRMRPLDQVEVLAGIGPRLAPDRDRAAELKPLIVVATQTIEAGADFDFDGLVTECASLDALRQRFGRLDRRGALSGSGPARAVVLARSDVRSSDDPVYGEALGLTWEWLRSVAEGGVIDFGIQALDPLIDGLGEGVERMASGSRVAPALLPGLIEQWGQTMPRPHADPDVSLFLHGIPDDKRSMAADVQVVWRADIGGLEVQAAADDPGELSEVVERVAVVPPSSLEALSLPVWAVREWLAIDGVRAEADELADIEGVPYSRDDEFTAARPVLLWAAEGDSRVIEGHHVGPGATIVVPASYGGIGTHRTFDPAETSAASDLGDRCQLRQRARAVLRLRASVWPRLGPHLDPEAGSPVSGRPLDHGDDALDILAALRTTVDDLDPELRKVVAALGAHPRSVRVGREGWALVGPPREADVHRIEAAEEPGGPNDEDSLVGVASELAPHLEGVADLAEQFGRRLGLPDFIVRTLYWAGRVHDIGKADPQFQYLLHGDEVSARFGPVLAKSDFPWQDVAARQAIRRRANYPRGQRHELVTLGLIEGSSELRRRIEDDGGDWELLLHLVASHHGWCRPMAPRVEFGGNDAEEVSWSVDGIPLSGTSAHGYSRLNSGVAERFFALSRRFGWHGLAYLEAILRLADHRQSAREAGHA